MAGLEPAEALNRIHARLGVPADISGHGAEGKLDRPALAYCLQEFAAARSQDLDRAVVDVVTTYHDAAGAGTRDLGPLIARAAALEFVLNARQHPGPSRGYREGHAQAQALSQVYGGPRDHTPVNALRDHLRGADNDLLRGFADSIVAFAMAHQRLLVRTEALGFPNPFRSLLEAGHHLVQHLPDTAMLIAVTLGQLARPPEPHRPIRGDPLRPDLGVGDSVLIIDGVPGRRGGVNGIITSASHLSDPGAGDITLPIFTVRFPGLETPKSYSGPDLEPMAPFPGVRTSRGNVSNILEAETLIISLEAAKVASWPVTSGPRERVDNADLIRLRSALSAWSAVPVLGLHRRLREQVIAAAERMTVVIDSAVWLPSALDHDQQAVSRSAARSAGLDTPQAPEPPTASHRRAQPRRGNPPSNKRRGPAR
ncbi:hypothetical protein [Thermomonospora umbrina]|uniref:Uncharacterized protein n=1 Tax=Thermomonospora umbrina TaxID=111806 RepID=A0A3D9SXG9_9ACTN|nr:hypothetical protein [Thermomonospora umbrina]REF00650.1 hypothetical protein DFJ69_6206 [Thermomonospora umbrina]